MSWRGGAGQWEHLGCESVFLLDVGTRSIHHSQPLKSHFCPVFAISPAWQAGVSRGSSHSEEGNGRGKGSVCLKLEPPTGCFLTWRSSAIDLLFPGEAQIPRPSGGRYCPLQIKGQAPSGRRRRYRTSPRDTSCLRHRDGCSMGHARCSRPGPREAAGQRWGGTGWGLAKCPCSPRAETEHQFFCLTKHLQRKEVGVVGKPLLSGRAMHSELAAFLNQPAPTTLLYVTLKM